MIPGSFQMPDLISVQTTTDGILTLIGEILGTYITTF